MIFDRAKRMPNGCLEWQGPRDRQGYGKVGGGALAHRAAYAMAKGDPSGKCVLHRCDNPPCVDPEHLWLGTIGDNNRDTAEKGRHWGMAATHCPHGHKFTPENIYNPPGKPLKRECRECIRQRSRKYAKRQREPANA